MKRFLYLICILTVAMACKEVFEAPPQSLLQASFYFASVDATTHKITETKASPKIILLGVGRDSLLYNSESKNNVLLPLTKIDTTRYIIWLDSKSDSLTFIHETTQKYASMETGFYYGYKLRSIRFTKNRIDSIKIVDSLITTKWHENIKLYIKPLSVSGN